MPVRRALYVARARATGGACAACRGGDSGRRGTRLVDRGVSAAVTLPGSIRPEQRGTVKPEFEQDRERLTRQKFLALDNEGRELWRIGFRVSDAQELSSELFENQLRRVVEPVLKAYEVREEILRHIEKQRADRR